MNEVAADLGSFICRTALEAGAAVAQAVHCYEAVAHQGLGYSAAVMLVILGTAAFRRFGRWA